MFYNKFMFDDNFLNKLEELARLKIVKNREKFYQDFQKIVDYFKELEKIDVSSINLEQEIKKDFAFNVFQKENNQDWFEKENLIDQFKEKTDKFLKLPNVFD